jgi:CRP-like cAMP-binding protein
MSKPPSRACSRDFPGTVEAASEAENWVAHQASGLGLGEDAEFAINLCLEELFLNAVQHGRANRATISVCAESDGVVVEFAELRAAIRATSAFRDLSDDNLALLIEAAELETFDPGAILIVQGEPSDCAMLILAGEVTVAADSARGAIPISTLKAPSLVGELGSLAQLPRSATARARSPVTALRFGRAALVEVARATPSLLIDVIAGWASACASSMAQSTSTLMRSTRSSVTSSIPRCSRSCAIRFPTSPISGRPSAAWPCLRGV